MKPSYPLGGREGRIALPGTCTAIAGIAVEIKGPEGFWRVRMHHITEATFSGLQTFISTYSFHNYQFFLLINN